MVSSVNCIIITLSRPVQLVFTLWRLAGLAAAVFVKAICTTSQTKKRRNKVHSSGSNVSRHVLEIEVDGLGLDNIVETH